MNSRWGLWAFGIIYVVFALWLVPTFLEGSLGGKLWSFGALVILALMPVIAIRRYWWLFYWGYMLIPLQLIQIPLVDGLGGVGTILLGIIFFLYLANISMFKEQTFARRWWVYRMMVLICVCIVLRVVSAMPSSARLSGTGGLGQAIIFVLAGVSLPAGYWATYSTTATLKKSVKFLLIIAFCSFLYSCRGLFEGGFYFGFLYDYRMWLLLGLPMVAILRKHADGARNLMPFYALSTLSLFFGVIQEHRRGVLFGIIQIISFVYAYRCARRMVLPLIVMLVAVFTLALVLYNAGIAPERFERALSLLSTRDVTVANVASSEYGWESSFRVELFARAWDLIALHPIVGHGFRFSTEEILQIVNYGSFMDLIAFTGAFHNVLLVLAVKCGLIVTVFYIAILFAILRKAIRWTRARANDNYKMYVTLLLGYTMASLIYAMVNGVGNEFLNLTVCLTVLCALMDKADDEADAAPIRATPSAALRSHATRNGSIQSHR